MSNNPDTDYIRFLTDDKCDPELGARIRDVMVTCGLETMVKPHCYEPKMAVEALQSGIKDAFHYLGLDPLDPSTSDTPRRYAAMVVGELTKGLNYDFFPKCTATPNGTRKQTGTKEVLRPVYSGQGLDTRVEVVSEQEPVYQIVGDHNQMVLVRDIQTMSLCEHHLQTIDGVTHIAYIPKTKVLGLSKFARVADFFARRPQIQERMTDQIYYALCYILETFDVAVVNDSIHYCMRARGAMQSMSRTQTNKMGGRFLSQEALRQEFLSAINR